MRKVANKEGTIKVIDEEDGTVVLEEYDGETKKFEVITILEVEGQDYLILLAEDEEEVGEGYALKVDEDETGSKVYRPVVDEDELVKLQSALREVQEE